MKMKTETAIDYALRALAKFTSHGGLLPPEEIDEILDADSEFLPADLSGPGVVKS